jgi:hypothetical protein
MTSARANVATQSAIEALIYDVRNRGLAALADGSRRCRITELNEPQLVEVQRRLAMRCPACPSGVPANIIAALVAISGKWKG